MYKITAEEQYLNLLRKIKDTGTDVYNDRTGKSCRTIINADLIYTPESYPLITTRKSYYKSAIAEFIGYLRGYDSAKDFRSIGCKTWDANANENKSWLDNPNRAGEDHMGVVYGAAAYRHPSYNHYPVDTITPVINKIISKQDDRGLIITWWTPTLFEYGCLRPCMHTHHFSILGDTLHLTSYQRSCDAPLGLVANMQQCYVFLAIMAKLSGLKQGNCYHKIVNAHIYEDQLPLVGEQLNRSVFNPPKLVISDELDSWETLMDHPDPVSLFSVENYQHHEPIKYPFSV